MARSKGLPEKPIAATLVSLVPSSAMAEVPWSASPVMGCNVGSVWRIQCRSRCYCACAYNDSTHDCTFLFGVVFWV